MGTIAWSAFTWEAFSTLVTGCAAVAAAAYVGVRQVAISRRQAEIFDRQIDLDELTLRSEIFERRFAVYESTKDLLLEVLRNACKASSETDRAFLIGLDKSKFLFPPSVETALRSLWEDYCRLGAVQSVMKARFERSGDYGAEGVEAEHKLLLAFGDRLNNLGELFGKEMRLVP